MTRRADHPSYVPRAVTEGIAAAWAILDRHATRARELCDQTAEAWTGAEEAVGFQQMCEALRLLDRAADALAVEVEARWRRIPRRDRAKRGAWRLVKVKGPRDNLPARPTTAAWTTGAK